MTLLRVGVVYLPQGGLGCQDEICDTLLGPTTRLESGHSVSLLSDSYLACLHMCGCAALQINVKLRLVLCAVFHEQWLAVCVCLCVLGMF